MVIPHLRVNYLTRNKWLANNLEDRGYMQGGQRGGGVVGSRLFCNPWPQHYVYKMDLCTFKHILKLFYVWPGNLLAVRMPAWTLMLALMGKGIMCPTNSATILHFLIWDLNKATTWNDCEHAVNRSLGRCTAGFIYLKVKHSFCCKLDYSLTRAVQTRNQAT